MSDTSFHKPSQAEWLKVISKELKQELTDFPSFEWEEGCVMPVIGSAAVTDRGMPGVFPFASGALRADNNWEINLSFDERNTNGQVLDALQRDVSSISIHGNVSIELLNHLLKDVHPQFIETHFFHTASAEDLLKSLSAWSAAHNFPAAEMRCFLGNDPLFGQSAFSADVLAKWTQQAREVFPLSKPVAVNATVYEAKGATLAQRLAFALAHGVEYMQALTSAGMNPDEAAGAIAFYMPVSVSFLHEIAAARSFRMLWANALSVYAVNEKYRVPYVQSVISDSCWSVYDVYNNLIRATLQSMAAVMGGCNSLAVKTFDAPAGVNTGFSLRLAANIQLLLKEEVYLGKVIDPLAGSGYIESLTEKLCSDAWSLFLQIENAGGLAAFNSSGELDKILKISSEKRKEKIKSGERPVIGLSKYRNAKEKQPDPGTERLVSFLEHEPVAEGGKKS